MDLRRHTRFRVDFGSNIQVGQVAGQGNVTDLSLSGCRIQSKVKLTTGMQLGLQVALPDSDWPLQIDEAVVRWTNGQEFGIEFLGLRPDQQERLSRFMDDLESGPLVYMRKVPR